MCQEPRKGLHQERRHLCTPAAVSVGSQDSLETLSTIVLIVIVRAKNCSIFFVTFVIIQQHDYQPWPVEGSTFVHKWVDWQISGSCSCCIGTCCLMLFSAPDASVPVPEEPASSWTHVSVAASTSLFCFEVRFSHLFFFCCGGVKRKP